MSYWFIWIQYIKNLIMYKIGTRFIYSQKIRRHKRASLKVYVRYVHVGHTRSLHLNMWKIHVYLFWFWHDYQTRWIGDQYMHIVGLFTRMNLLKFEMTTIFKKKFKAVLASKSEVRNWSFRVQTETPLKAAKSLLWRELYIHVRYQFIWKRGRMDN